jgi:hypothetical protein
MWVEALLLLAAVLPLLVESKCNGPRDEPNTFVAPEQFPILSPIQIEAARASQPRQEPQP